MNQPHCNRDPAEVREFAEKILVLTTLRVVDLHAARGYYLSGTSVLARGDLQPEHRQVQVVVSAGGDAGSTAKLVPGVLPPVLEGLTIRDFRTGLAILSVSHADDLAEQVAELLEPDVVVHLYAVASGELCVQLLCRLSDPEARRQAVEWSGDAGIRFESETLRFQGGRLPEYPEGVILDRVALIHSAQAAGGRLEQMLDNG